MADGAEQSSTAELKVWAHDARARTTACAAHADRAAESAAVRSNQVERIIERLAERNPQHTKPLHRFYADRSGGQQLPKRQDEPEAAAFAALDIYLRDMAVVQERERIAGELLDTVIQRVFAAGLTLEGAAGLTAKPEVRQRIEEAAADLDDVIRAVRDTVFNLPYPMNQPDSRHQPGDRLLPPVPEPAGYCRIRRSTSLPARLRCTMCRRGSGRRRSARCSG
jgi:signal transduction histidine kinase